MKKAFSIKIIIQLLLVIVVFQSCKKDDEVPGGNTGNILGKWYFEKEFTDNYVAGVHDTASYWYTPGDYIDFNSNGKAYYSIYDSTLGSNYFDSSSYEMLGRLKIVFDATDTLDIQSHINQSLTLYRRLYSGTDYSDNTLYLHR